MNIIKFKDGTFGVRKTHRILWREEHEFLDARPDTTQFIWWSEEYASKYCKFQTIEEAREAMRRADTSYEVIE